MSCSNEQLDEAGNPIRVADLTFVGGVLGHGAYGTVHLARRSVNLYDAADQQSALSSAEAAPASPIPTFLQTPPSGQTGRATLNRVSSAGLPPAPSIVGSPGGGSRRGHGGTTTPQAARLLPRSRRGDHGGFMARSNSAPVGDDFFRMDPPPDAATAAAAVPHSPMVQKAHYTFNALFARSDSMRNNGSGGGVGRRSWSRKSSANSNGSDEAKEQDEQLVAVKIFRKSVLKRRRTMERDKDTRKMLVKTALEKVEREIALMKKLAHPNLVDFYEAIDSPDSDMLYLVSAERRRLF